MRIIMSGGIKFNEFEMPCKWDEEQKESVRKESPVEVEQVNVYNLITSCEMESNIKVSRI